MFRRLAGRSVAGSCGLGAMGSWGLVGFLGFAGHAHELRPRFGVLLLAPEVAGKGDHIVLVRAGRWASSWALGFSCYSCFRCQVSCFAVLRLVRLVRFSRSSVGIRSVGSRGMCLSGRLVGAGAVSCTSFRVRGPSLINALA